MRRLLSWSVSLVAFTGVVLWTLQDADLESMPRDLGLSSILMGAVYYLLTLAVRTLRFQLMIRNVEVRPLRFGQSAQLIGLSNLLNHVLPFRSGELFFVFFTGVLHEIPLTRATFVVVALRLFDLLGLVVLVLFATLPFASELGLHGGHWWALSTLAALLLSFVVLADGWARLIRRTLELLGLNLVRFESSLETLVDRGARLRAPMLLLPMLGLTLVIWLLLCLSFGAFVAAAGFELGLGALVLASLGPILASILPINAVGSLGTLEAGWVVGFVWAGLGRADALVTGLVMHLCILVISGLVGALAIRGLGSHGWSRFKAWRAARIRDA